MKGTHIYKLLRASLYNTNEKDYKAPLLADDVTNDSIKNFINSGHAFMVSRLGSNELSVLRVNSEKKEYSKKQNDLMESCAGFFPVTKHNLDQFSELYFNAIPNIDLLGVWMNPFEDTIANEHCPSADITKLRNLEPYFATSPWTSALKNKRVLVIHPFSESIKKQYSKRTALFEDSQVLPKFTLITYKAVQSLGGHQQYSSWFDALAGMQADISAIDFDIAIIGAGAYGLPLAAYIKSMGKGAIHLGGATQLLFGIYGRRWEVNPDFQHLINEHWTRPLEGEKPKAASQVENGCYW